MRIEPGIIEGFFGRPWEEAARLASAPWLKAQGYGYYIYAPKAERMLRRQWRDSMPEEHLAKLAALSRAFRTGGMRLGVGLSPYGVHLGYSGEDKAALRSKVAQLNRIGLDMLCVLFDDMHGAVPGLAQLQGRVVADIASWTDAADIICCPTYYSDDPVLARVFGQPPENYLADLGGALDPAVGVFWTGQQVCSAGYPDQHLENVAHRLGRKPVIWDNHISNDARERCSHLYLDALAGGWSVNARLVEGLVINPMNQAALSRIPLGACAAQFAGTISGSGQAYMACLARSICGESLGQELLTAANQFQKQGLSRLAAPERSRLVARFQPYAPDPCAEELCSWLRGEYAFDPQCLTE